MHELLELFSLLFSRGSFPLSYNFTFCISRSVIRHNVEGSTLPCRKIFRALSLCSILFCITLLRKLQLASLGNSGFLNAVTVRLCLAFSSYSVACKLPPNLELNNNFHFIYLIQGSQSFIVYCDVQYLKTVDSYILFVFLVGCDGKAFLHSHSQGRSSLIFSLKRSSMVDINKDISMKLGNVIESFINE